NLPVSGVSKVVRKPPVSTAAAVDQSAEVAGAKALAKTGAPALAEPKPLTASTEGADLAGTKTTPKPSTPVTTTRPAPLASRAKVFEGISEYTEQLLSQRP